MNIIIAGQIFTFSDSSIIKVESGEYDLYITEPNFDESSEEWIEQFIKDLH